MRFARSMASQSDRRDASSGAERARALGDHQAVQPSESREGRLDRARHGALVGGVPRRDERRAPVRRELARQALELRAAPGQEGELGAFPREGPGRRRGRSRGSPR